MSAASPTDAHGKWSQKSAVRNSDLRLPQLGLGTAPIANLFKAISEAQACEVLDEAWSCGLRYFDTAPLYGHGLAEKRLGLAMAKYARDEWVFSTKVGRLLRPTPDGRPPQAQEWFTDLPPFEPIWDFSYDGVMTSLAESLDRLGVDRADILFLHDPDDFLEMASTSAYQALHALRADGRVRAIGAGMTQTAALSRLVQELDLEVVMLAGRYTLLEQGALDDLFPVCEQKGTWVVIGGAFNSGVLVEPSPAARYDYLAAPGHILAKARRIQQVCSRYDVPIGAAALQFPLAHPQVSTVVFGCASPEELRTDLAWMDWDIPAALWDSLRRDGLLRPDAPVPSGQ